MTLQVLVSTMHQKQGDYSLLEKMNIRTDAIIVNQCDNNGAEQFEYYGNKILWINTEERGIGKSRNRAIIASSADVIMFADDDVVYDNNAFDYIQQTFNANRSIDMAVFTSESLNPDRPETIITKKHRLHFWNCLKYGAFQFVIRRECLLRTSIMFSLNFGGGAQYQAGEDCLFVTKMIFSGLRCYAIPIKLGTVAQEASTWFKGYDTQYYLDRGALFYAMYGPFAKMIMLLFEVRNPGDGFFSRLKNEYEGMKIYNKKV